MDKEKVIDAEDQLFFGLVLTLAFFIITLPIGDITTYFQSFIKGTEAYNFAQQIKNGSIILLLGSALLRYYAIMKPSKTARMFSFLALWVTLDYFLFGLIPNYFETIFNNSLVYVISIFGLIIGYLLLSRVENSMLLFYSKKGCFPKKYSRPYVSIFL
jgi:hypothetical protein